MSADELNKLRSLLEYWIKHNGEHGQEFREWADKAKGLGASEVAEDLLHAVQEIDKTNDILAGALKKLGVKES